MVAKTLRTNTGEVLVYTSDAIERLIQKAKIFARGDAAVLIEGESGSGKEFLARYIYELMISLHGEPGNTDLRKFVEVNCSTLQENLASASIFGTLPYAYTGANPKGTDGLIHKAANGVLYLNEIGILKRDVQPQLLRVIEGGDFFRVGGEGGKPEKAKNVRIIAATSRILEEDVAKRIFSNDLYHRLVTVHFRIPPLRERREDIPPIAEFMLEGIVKTNAGAVADKFNKAALESLAEQDFKGGNARTLYSEVYQAAFMVGAKGRKVITADDFPFVSKKPAAVNGNGRARSSFGDQLIQRRADRGWTEDQLAIKANEKVPQPITQRDIINWQNNIGKPDNDAAGALAYVLILDNKDLTADEKKTALKDFFATLQQSNSVVRDQGLAALIVKYRCKGEKKLTEQDLADLTREVSKITNEKVVLSTQNIIDIELGKSVTKPEAVALVRALDKEKGLSPEEKAELYFAASGSFIAESKAQIPSRRKKTGIKEVDDLMDEVERLFEEMPTGRKSNKYELQELFSQIREVFFTHGVSVEKLARDNKTLGENAPPADYKVFNGMFSRGAIISITDTELEALAKVIKLGKAKEREKFSPELSEKLAEIFVRICNIHHTLRKAVTLGKDSVDVTEIITEVFSEAQKENGRFISSIELTAIKTAIAEKYNVKDDAFRSKKVESLSHDLMGSQSNNPNEFRVACEQYNRLVAISMDQRSRFLLNH